jgi:hypothetical protein
MWFSKWNRGKRKTKQTYPRFEFKPHQVNYSSQSNQVTNHLISQSPLDESVDNKSTKFEVRIQDPMKHSWKTQKAKKSSRRSSRRRKTAKANKRYENGKAKQNGKEEVRKAQKSKKSSNSRQTLKISTKSQNQHFPWNQLP